MTVPYRGFSKRRKTNSKNWPCTHWRGFLLATFGLLVVAFAVLDYPVGVMGPEFNPDMVYFGNMFTHLGKSDWMLFASFMAMMVGLGTAGAADRRTRAKGVFLAQAATFVFTSIAFSGIIVALIKGLVGRPRPYLMFAREISIGPFAFEPFSFDPDFASFPSGHATAVAVVFTCAAFFIPRYRVLFFTLAVLLAMSRTLVSAHYPSDVIAGLAFGTWFTYFMAIFFSRYRMVFRIDEAGMPVPRNSIKYLKPGRMRHPHPPSDKQTDLDLRAQKGH